MRFKPLHQIVLIAATVVALGADADQCTQQEIDTFTLSEAEIWYFLSPSQDNWESIYLTADTFQRQFSLNARDAETLALMFRLTRDSLGWHTKGPVLDDDFKDSLSSSFAALLNAMDDPVRDKVQLWLNSCRGKLKIRYGCGLLSMNAQAVDNIPCR